MELVRAESSFSPNARDRIRGAPGTCRLGPLQLSLLSMVSQKTRPTAFFNAMRKLVLRTREQVDIRSVENLALSDFQAPEFRSVEYLNSKGRVDALHPLQYVDRAAIEDYNSRALLSIEFHKTESGPMLQVFQRSCRMSICCSLNLSRNRRCEEKLQPNLVSSLSPIAG
eukprot:scaffold7994_cov123-Cylindrotheca_fusiformis.AAC.3